jgi:hypothetical protein
MKILVLFCRSLAVLAFSIVTADASEVSKIAAPFQNNATGSFAAGKARSVILASKSRLLVKATGLEPSTNYTFYADDRPILTFVTNSRGRGRMKFTTPQTSTSLLLNFDPRGKTLRINNSTDDILTSVHSGPGESPGIRVLERTDFTGTQPGSKVNVKFTLRSDGHSKFTVQLEGFAAGSYLLFVDGLQRATITVPASGSGKVEFDSLAEPPKLPLDFDPRGKQLDILFNNVLVATEKLVAEASGVNVCKFTLREKTLTATPAAAGGRAEARYRLRDDCEEDFRVQIEDVPAGLYDLLVDDIPRGTISVVSTNGGTEGEIEFDTDADEPHEIYLTFDASAADFTIQRAGTIYFQGKLTGKPGDADCDLQETELPLFNTGADSDAKGKARFRQDTDCDRDFRVEIENLPAGEYKLRVAGIEQGTITVALDLGEMVGHIEFDTDPDQPGEILLTFDPRGQLIEIIQDGTVYLSRTFPD